MCHPVWICCHNSVKRGYLCTHGASIHPSNGLRVRRQRPARIQRHLADTQCPIQSIRTTPTRVRTATRLPSAAIRLQQRTQQLHGISKPIRTTTKWFRPTSIRKPSAPSSCICSPRSCICSPRSCIRFSGATTATADDLWLSKSTSFRRVLSSSATTESGYVHLQFARAGLRTETYSLYCSWLYFYS